MTTRLHVGARAPAYRREATYFDGRSPRPQKACAITDDAAGLLRIVVDDSLRETWAFADIREIPDAAAKDILVLRSRGDSMARLILPDRDVLPRLPDADLPPPAKGRGRLLSWAFAAIASVALIVGILVPRLADRLAVFIPPEGERALGEVTLDQIRSALGQGGVAPVGFCTDRNCTAALDRMQARLTAGSDLPHELTVSVLDHPMVNAFALPGGYVVLFRGLIEKAEAPDEVAAVLAHEIGHVISRDPTRHALRSAGSIGVLGLLFGDFAGGALVLFLAERLIDAQYSQEAEAEADTFAHATMRDAGLAPEALARMFEHLGDGPADSGLAAHFMAHPSLGDRIAAARAATPDGFTASPVLSRTEWRALQDICGDD